MYVILSNYKIATPRDFLCSWFQLLHSFVSEISIGWKWTVLGRWDRYNHSCIILYIFPQKILRSLEKNIPRSCVKVRTVCTFFFNAYKLDERKKENLLSSLARATRFSTRHSSGTLFLVRQRTASFTALQRYISRQKTLWLFTWRVSWEK